MADYQWDPSSGPTNDEPVQFEPEELFTYNDYQEYSRFKFANDGQKVSLEMKSFRRFMETRQASSLKRRIPLIEIKVENGKLRIRGTSDAIGNLANKLKENELLRVELEKCQQQLKS